MVIWSGFGFVVVLIAGVALVLTEMLSERITADQQFYQTHQWLVSIAMVIAATATYGFQMFLERRARVTNDANLPACHTLFFVAVKWWPAILVVIGIAMLFGKPGR